MLAMHLQEGLQRRRPSHTRLVAPSLVASSAGESVGGAPFHDPPKHAGRCDAAQRASWTPAERRLDQAAVGQRPHDRRVAELDMNACATALRRLAAVELLPVGDRLRAVLSGLSGGEE